MSFVDALAEGITDHIFHVNSPLRIVKIAFSRKKYAFFDEIYHFGGIGDHSFVKIALAGLGQNEYENIRA
ncbi:hypothetical protein [Asticcacaulis sp. 201]|uniref:hypothetical protein n=1 Tax=Asticcacaulis sp. 201 TaxID=3028787 RepID=UPI002915EF35|nr:hypothetical protein [Asticcacaulis sp. 201]MDV6329675.1 hypothetical protein [Asticcacaulis sp. 201]